MSNKVCAYCVIQLYTGEKKNMATFQIVATELDYKILDVDGSRLIAEGISSYQSVLALYERLISVQDGPQSDSVYGVL